MGDRDEKVYRWGRCVVPLVLVGLFGGLEAPTDVVPMGVPVEGGVVLVDSGEGGERRNCPVVVVCPY